MWKHFNIDFCISAVYIMWLVPFLSPHWWKWNQYAYDNYYFMCWKWDERIANTTGFDLAHCIISAIIHDAGYAVGFLLFCCVIHLRIFTMVVKFCHAVVMKRFPSNVGFAINNWLYKVQCHNISLRKISTYIFSFSYIVPEKWKCKIQQPLK